MRTSVDPWDEVWDAYEARRAATEVVAPPPPAPRPAAGLERRRARGWATSLLAVAVFGLGCATGSAWPVLNLYGLVLRQDAPALLRQIDLSPARDGLQQALRAHAGLPEAATGGAGALLAGMAEEMAAAMARPGALEQVVMARREGPWPLRDPAAPPLHRIRAAWGGSAVELGPESGTGGFGLDLAWTGEGWQAVAVRLLDAPSAAAGRAVPVRLASAGPG
jgi:hypothetical protein